ncbi:hypothetical protein D3C71_1524740 [compost metagenome]
MPPAVSPTTMATSRGYFIRPRSELVLGLVFWASLYESVSGMSRRISAVTMASMAPITKGMRQPHSTSCSCVRNTFCSSSSTRIAQSWPPIRVTYWKLE